MRDEALAYLDSMNVVLGKRVNQAKIDYLENDASTLELILYNVASVPEKIFGGAIAFVDDTIDGIKGEEINPYNCFQACLQ